MDKLQPQSEDLASAIFLIRGQRVMQDADLAMVYGVETRILNLAVKRNVSRFPEDFMFQLTKEEFENLRSQSEISRWGGRRHLPFVFTEHGAVMMASLLNSPRAIEASIYVVRAFVKLRHMLASYKELEKRIEELEKSTKKHLQDQDIKIERVFEALRLLLQEEKKPRRQIGYKRKDEKE